ncbi:hypothetical protein [Burkholderia multivorans]|uniref:hypothetical protein n=1 Tax=Burkholderia multivorans TaxID=87883 RepID=UPI001B9D5D4F|nr:hypothetical protein [Burkholderia multivorans]MBR7899936.1 hypothetical protein [Burkholderia multivorans]
MDALTQWATTQQAEVKAGRKLRSAFYSEYYERVSNPPDGPMDVVLMRESLRMIDISKQYEANKISSDQYQTEQRNSAIRIREQSDRVAAEGQAADAQRRNAALAILGSGALYRPPPQVPYQPMPVPAAPINTTCQRFGTMTNCTTY